MANRLASARWESRTSGVVALARDWDRPGSPPLSLPPPAALTLLERADPRVHARRSGHWIEGGEVHFFLWKALAPDLVDGAARVVGPFNDWGNAGDPDAWLLHAVCVAGADGFLCVARQADVLPRGGVTSFKFRLGDGRWIEPPHDADNIQRDWQGHRNLVLDRHRTGLHLFRFVAAGADALAAPQRIAWDDGALRESCDILACGPLDQLRPPGRLGALAANGRTTFRIFAPRATAVAVDWSVSSPAGPPRAGRLDLRPEGQGAWAGSVDQDLAGAAYLYRLEPGALALPDPWARHTALLGGQPATYVAGADEAPRADGFSPPRPEELVILEAHLRDLLALRGDASRAGFRELADWIRRDGAYLRSLGVNTLELLPCAEFERGPDPAEYHWGYMPVSAFAPASAYAPGGGRSPSAEFRDLVAACHEAGLALVVDLVLNHFGSPNLLLALDPDYWFRRDASGALSNLSGCGNDFRAESPLGARLAADAVLHWLTVLGADGVRLDLAELLGVAVLRDIEAEVRARAPGKILIAEPWSFRGHVGPELDGTSWTSWDDGFREFLPAFVRGNARAADLLHQMAGLGIRPSARLRYFQSHDDHAWVDRITERPSGDASDPAPADFLRTRLAHLILLASAGVPMLAAGQDFLHTKRGVGNTWRRGDLNALDPARLARFASEHAFVAALIRFRLSEAGAPLRPHAAVSPGWMTPRLAEGSEAFAAELNADGALGPARALVAANPHPWPVRIPLAAGPWTPVVLSPRPDCPHAPGPSPAWEGDTLVLPPLGCGLWSR
jgi:pullulanase/glycogen debranching enzyme